MLDTLTVDDFNGLIGATVTLRFGPQNESARVVEAHTVGQSPKGLRQPFAVTVVTNATDHYWPQGTYVLEHPDHGDLELFMVPVGPGQDESGMRYQISFS